MAKKSVNRSILLTSLYLSGFATTSILSELIKSSSIFGKESNATVHFISLYGGSLMIGLWAGVLAAFGLSVNYTIVKLEMYSRTLHYLPGFLYVKNKRILTH